MKMDQLSVTGINFPVTMIRPLSLRIPRGIQKHHKRFPIRIQQVLLTVTCIFWMNVAFSQPIVKVIGSADSVTVLKQVTRYLEYLDIRENVRLAVIFPRTMPENYAGFTTCLNGADSNDLGYLNIKVYVDGRQPKFLQRLVLAHEMIHVKQYAKRELIVNSKREVMWKGQRYSSHNAEQGDPRPWELEAYRNDARLVKAFKDQTEILLPVSNTDAYVDQELNEKQISDFQQKY